MKIKILFIVFLTLTYLKSYPQIVNSVSADKSGMYFYAIDTLTKSFDDDEFSKIALITTDSRLIQDFPNTINGYSSRVLDKNNWKIKEIDTDEILISIVPLTIIRNQVTITIGTTRRVGKELRRYSDSAYTFYFKYIPESKNWILRKIDKGLVL